MRLPSVERVAGDLLGELGAAVREHLLERLQARRQHFADRVALGGDGGGEVLGVLAEGLGDLVAAGDDGLGDAGAGLLELGHDVAAAQAEIEDERVAGRLQRRVHLVAGGGDGFGQAARGVDQACR